MCFCSAQLLQRLEPTRNCYIASGTTDYMALPRWVEDAKVDSNAMLTAASWFRNTNRDLWDAMGCEDHLSLVEHFPGLPPETVGMEGFKCVLCATFERIHFKCARAAAGGQPSSMGLGVVEGGADRVDGPWLSVHEPGAGGSPSRAAAAAANASLPRGTQPLNCNRCLLTKGGYTFRWCSAMWFDVYIRHARPGSWGIGGACKPRFHGQKISHLGVVLD